MLYALCDDGSFSAEIEYAFDVLLGGFEPRYSFLTHEQSRGISFRDQDVVVAYGSRVRRDLPANLIHIYRGNLFGENYLRKESLPTDPLSFHQGLPVIYKGGGGLAEPVVVSRAGEKDLLETDIDLVASCFFLLTGYEEMLGRERDRHDRYPAAASLASRGGFLRFPVVNGYIGLLEAWLQRCNPAIRRRRPWGKREFAACITHDIDSLEKFRRDNTWKKIAKVAVGEHDLCEAGERIAARMGREPYDTFDHILELDRQWGFKSTFYFLADGTGQPDSSYTIDSPRTAALLHRLKAQSEIGLHGGFSSFNDARILGEEKRRLETELGSPVRGIRQHFLRFQPPLTWRVQEEAGLLYDTTLSFPEEEGFRGGICVPFQPFDVSAKRKIGLWEVPLTLMDATLFEYRKLRADESFERVKTLIDTVRRYNGVFVLLWHNSALDETKIPGVRRLYRRILEYLHEHDPFTGSVAEIVEAWKKHRA